MPLLGPNPFFFLPLWSEQMSVCVRVLLFSRWSDENYCFLFIIRLEFFSKRTYIRYVFCSEGMKFLYLSLIFVYVKMLSVLIKKYCYFFLRWFCGNKIIKFLKMCGLFFIWYMAMTLCTFFLRGVLSIHMTLFMDVWECVCVWHLIFGSIASTSYDQALAQLPLPLSSMLRCSGK